MLLALDVGNTQTVYGTYREGKLVDVWRLPTDAKATRDRLRLDLAALCAQADEPSSLSEVDRVALASVVPELTHAWRSVAERALGVPCVEASWEQCREIFPCSYPNPHEIGADRIADAVAARVLFGTPAIVVDLGTATNIEAIDEDGRFVGGAIAPGIVTGSEALFARAARLSAIELTAPPRAIGSSTAEAMQAGIVLGEADRIDGLVRRMKAELGGDAVVVATGGLARVVAEHARTIDFVEPALTLHGLRIIAERAG